MAEEAFYAIQQKKNSSITSSIPVKTTTIKINQNFNHKRNLFSLKPKAYTFKFKVIEKHSNSLSCTVCLVNV